MDNKQKVYGVSFNLDDYEDIKTLKELEDENPFPKLDGVDKREAESELFNLVYAYNNDVDAGKSSVKIMKPIEKVEKPADVVTTPPPPPPAN